MMVVKGIFVRRDRIFDAIKCDLLFACEASFSVKMLLGMTIIGVKLMHCKSIVQIRIEILWRPFIG